MKQPLLLDGAMGTELLRRGMLPGACPEWQCVEHPGLVSAIHGDYRQAGAQALTTNSFGANRYRLSTWGLQEQVHAINVAAVRVARSRADGRVVAGSVGPTGRQHGIPAWEELREVYREQARGLHGVDVFTCETFGDVAELRAAVLGIRDVSEQPIWAQMFFLENGRTVLDRSPEEVAASLDDLPIAAIGVNCEIGPETTATVIAALRKVTDLPLIARPNAGQPVKEGRNMSYPLGPERFAEIAVDLARAVSIVGGCCGTTPRYVEAARERIG